MAHEICGLGGCAARFANCTFILDVWCGILNASSTTKSCGSRSLPMSCRSAPTAGTAKNRCDKLCSLHAPKVECISKGKAHKRYEYGVKASIAVTNRGDLVVGGLALPGNPYCRLR